MSSALLYGHRSQRQRLILDPATSEVRCACKATQLSDEDIALLRLAWDHKGERLEMYGVARYLNRGDGYGSMRITDVDETQLAQAKLALRMLAAKLSRLGTCPIHERQSGWTWDGSASLVELSTALI